MAKTAHFWIRMEPLKRARLRAMAASDGISEAEFIRRLVDAEDTKRAKAMRRLQRLGQEREKD